MNDHAEIDQIAFDLVAVGVFMWCMVLLSCALWVVH